MKIAYFDCFSGISGDMVLGALVDAGLDEKKLVSEIQGLGLPGIELSFVKEMRGFLSGTRAEVKVKEGDKHRHLSHIHKIIQSSRLSSWVKDRACAIFSRLAEAEAEVHGISIEKVHFHEVGALDAIVDVVGAAAGLHLLGIEKVYVSPIAVGTGYVKCQHGVIPVPPPATARLVQGFTVRMTSVERELTTPTGAAIVSTLAERTAIPSFVMDQVGYGLGSPQEGDLPNALRLLVGHQVAALEEVLLLETNLDDVTGEMAGYFVEKALHEGALDAYLTPVQMKKSRPGMILSVLIRNEELDKFRQLIHGETGSLGIRVQPVSRSILSRSLVTIKTSWGPVKVKKADIPGWPVSYSPEYDDIARIAGEKKVPFRLVWERVMAELSAPDKE